MTNILNFMEEFSKLTQTQQRVFLYCLQECPRPHAYSEDVRKIANATKLHVRTVQRALCEIRTKPKLANAVYFSKFNSKKELYHAEQERIRQKQAENSAEFDL